MKTLQFSRIINAPAQKIWEILWNNVTYPIWTKSFNPGGDSILQSDWQVGGRTLFLDEKGNGMISTIKSKKEPYEIVFEHVGEIINGVENTFIEKIKNGSGFLEEYILKENNGITTVTATVQASENLETLMNTGFTNGLEELKRLSEQSLLSSTKNFIMDNPLSKSLTVVIPGYRMHTQMFNNMLDGIKETDAQKRIDEKTNHVAWMVGNLVNCRYWLANILGIADKDPNEELFKNAKALDTNVSYPTLEELKKEWHKISPVLYKKLLTVEDAELQENYPSGMDIPFVEENKRNVAGMCIDRESYLFGQLGLMRKLLGYEGVKYDVDEKINY